MVKIQSLTGHVWRHCAVFLSQKRKTDSVGNRIALSPTSGTGPLFPTQPKWAIGERFGGFKWHQCHPVVSHPAKMGCWETPWRIKEVPVPSRCFPIPFPIAFGNFPGAKRLFSAPGRRKNRILGAERPVFAPGDRKKVAKGRITGLGPRRQGILLARSKSAGIRPGISGGRAQ